MTQRAIVLIVVAWLSLVFFPVARLWAQQLELPARDLSGPRVQHEPLDEAVPAGKPFEISVTVTDDTGVKAVSLFYRHKDDGRYTRVPMTQVGKPDNYMANIPGEATREPGVEYYIQAEDLAGNAVLRGFEFQPLVVEVTSVVDVTPEEPPTTGTGTPTPTPDPPKKKRTWLYVLGGVGAVVLLGAALGGGSGGSSDPETTGTVNFEAPNPQ